MVIHDLSTLNRVTQIYAGLRSQTEMEIEKIGNRSPRSPRSNISFPFFFFFFFFAQQTAPNETFTKSKEFRTFDGHGAIEVCEKQTGEALFSILIFLQRISRFFVTCILFFFFFLFLFNILANIRIDIDNYNYS